MVARVTDGPLDDMIVVRVVNARGRVRINVLEVVEEIVKLADALRLGLDLDGPGVCIYKCLRVSPENIFLGLEGRALDEIENRALKVSLEFRLQAAASSIQRHCRFGSVVKPLRQPRS